MKTPFLLLFSLPLLLGGCSKNEQHLSTDIDPTGIAECDAYFARAAACAQKTSPETRAAHDAAILVLRDMVEVKTKVESDRAPLAEACKGMSDGLEWAMANGG